MHYYPKMHMKSHKTHEYDVGKSIKNIKNQGNGFLFHFFRVYKRNNPLMILQYLGSTVHTFLTHPSFRCNALIQGSNVM